LAKIVESCSLERKILSSENLKSAEERTRIIQITDSHLFADEAALLAGMNCNEGLSDVIELVQGQESDIAGVLCTGDIAQDGSIAGYRRFASMVSRLSPIQRWIPGNHDIPDAIRAALGSDNACLEKTLQLGKWKIIMLDSCLEGHIYGLLAASELSFLERELNLSMAENFHVLVSVHHNPVPVAASWLQNHSLKNSDEFLAVIDRYPAVKCVLFGHIHQDFQQKHNDVLMLGSPSTCIQFHPEHDYFSLDDLNPGYRWLELNGDGSIRTGVERVGDKNYHVDLSSRGY